MTHWKCEEDGTEFEFDGERGYCPNCGRRAIRSDATEDAEDRTDESEENSGEHESDSDDSSSDSTASNSNARTTESNQGRKVPESNSPRKPTGSKRGGTKTVTVKGSEQSRQIKRIAKPAGTTGRRIAPTVSKKVVTNKDKAREHENEYESTWTHVKKVSGFGR